MPQVSVVGLAGQPLEVITTASSGSIPPNILQETLDTNGDGTGTINAIGDYSGAEEIFYIQPPASTVYKIERFIVYLRGAKADINLDTYGKNNVLSNGITVRIQNDSGTVVSFTNSLPIKRFAGWVRVSMDGELLGTKDDFKTDKILVSIWDIPHCQGYPLCLDGDNNERLEVVLNDDFGSGGASLEIDTQYFICSGWIV